MISSSLQKELVRQLTQYLNYAVEIVTISSVHGGDINAAYHLQTNAGSFFVKTNSATRYPGMFEAEQKGLDLLRTSSSLKIPNAIAVGQNAKEAFLLLEFLHSGPQQPDFWPIFGAALAQLHQSTANQFGLDHNNYIGSLPQSNSHHTTWVDFFVAERLEAQCRLARNTGAIDSGMVHQFERFFHHLENLFPVEPPSLVHGDLWSGNFHVSDTGQPCLIDPAVYYGHREMDLGMTLLFGGFAPEFYSAYQDEFPLGDDWQKRIPVAQLYPLLVHVNLFGGGYVQQVKSILHKFA